MELVEIIYSILIITGFLFGIIIITSFLISKARGPVIRPSIKIEPTPAFVQVQNSAARIIRDEQNQISSNRISNQKAFQSNQRKDEINIIRIPNSQQQTLTIEQIEERKRNGKGLRYSIVNEKVKKSNIRAANFYL